MGLRGLHRALEVHEAYVVETAREMTLLGDRGRPLLRRRVSDDLIFIPPGGIMSVMIRFVSSSNSRPKEAPPS